MTEFNFRKEVIKEFEKQTTFSKEELSTIYAILGIKFDKFIRLLKEKKLLCVDGVERVDIKEIDKLTGDDLRNKK